jgi:hypothetical protein
LTCTPIEGIMNSWQTLVKVRTNGLYSRVECAASIDVQASKVPGRSGGGYGAEGEPA